MTTAKQEKQREVAVKVEIWEASSHRAFLQSKASGRGGFLSAQLEGQAEGVGQT